MRSFMKSGISALLSYLTELFDVKIQILSYLLTAVQELSETLSGFLPSVFFSLTAQQEGLSF